MIIYNRDGSVLADVWLQESSFVNEEIMGDHSTQIDFLSRYPIDLEIGDYIEHEGNIYTLRHKESVTKRETSLGWDCSVVMYSARYELQDVPFFLSDEPQYLKNGDYYTGTASDWLNLIIRNMNREISGWAAGSCVESEWITISFKDKQCSEVLDELCAQLDTEWQVIGRALSIGRVEYPSDGLVLSQGEGGGLKELRLSSSNQERPVTVLYPYGSDKNLPEGYGSDYLLLPGGQKVMERNVDKYGRCGMKVQFNVYPKGEFTVTSVMDDLTFTAEGIDFDLAACLIPDTEVIVSFKSGALAGYDLAIAEDGWDNATKQITVLQNEEENALKVPGDIHIAVGDRFELFNLRMPQSYVTKAKEELKAKAEAWLAKKSEKEVRLSAKCDDILFRQCGVRIRCGQMVRILSLELDMDREIRVTKVKRHIENDCPTYRYELTLSDFLDTNGFKQLVKEVENVPEEIKTETKPFKAWTRRSWRDAIETIEMLEKSMLDNFTERISPIAVQTMSVLVGDESLQFRFVSSRTNPAQVDHSIVWDNSAKRLIAASGILQHMTLGISSLTSNHSVSEYKFWDIARYESEPLIDGSKSYYLYAKVSNTAKTGVFLLSETAIKMEEVDGYYHLLVGILNSEYDGDRSFVTLYGFTEILPGRITTDSVVSADGQSYFDFVSNSFKLGSKLVYNNGILKIDGAIEWGSLDSNMQNRLNGYATTQSLGEALQNYATYDNLADAVKDKVSTSTLTEKLKSYALTSALENYATTSDLNGKEDSGTADTVLGAFWKALKEGDTTIYNGVISTDFIDVDTISANLVIASGAKVGGFNINDDGSMVASSNSNSISVCGGLGYIGETQEHNTTCYGYFSALSADAFYSYGAVIDGNLACNTLTVGGSKIGAYTKTANKGSDRTLVTPADYPGNYLGAFAGRWGDYWQYFFYSSGSTAAIGWVTTSSTGSNTAIVTLERSGTTINITAANGKFLDSSDARKKRLLSECDITLDDIETIKNYHFRWKDEDDSAPIKCGVIAQELMNNKKFLPFVGSSHDENNEEWYSVDYGGLAVAVSVKGIQELHAKVKALEERVKALEG